MSNYKTVFFTLGILQVILGFAMVIPIVIQFIYNELDSSFISSGIITIILLRDGAIDLDFSKLAIYEHLGGSGNKIKKHYCKNCAAPILTTLVSIINSIFMLAYLTILIY